ncbi:hypothetical protein [Corynebacterium cystitidis]|uniref:hypothetical protein n=1 Tax=Corynebacterium cystitidis TaxID=35757 RepID=UPI00211F4252|nr:hypothetical protein [Corynebacterium cystitidis]
MSASTKRVDPDIHDVKKHVPPGRKRAPFFRYIRINLPRLTRAVLLFVIGLLGVCAFYVSVQDFDIFVGSDTVLYFVAGLSLAFVLYGMIFYKQRVWDFGLLPAFAALFTYAGGLFGTAPYVWNGAELYTAAAWNTLMFCGFGYLLLRWAIGYGVLVAYPDSQGFED